MKILILLLYYDRPKMVENALKSIGSQNYDDWEVAFLDDGSANLGKPVVDRILAEYPTKIKFYNTNDSVKNKLLNGGSRIGMLMNQAIRESDAEITFMLCDDDALFPGYLTNLNKWFTNNPNKQYCYSDVILFDPFSETPTSEFKSTMIQLYYTKVDRYKSPYNKGIDIAPISGLLGVIDASQPAWRSSCNKKGSIWFPYPQTCNLDISFLTQMYQNYGICSYSGFIGQYKAIHRGNLSTKRAKGEKFYQIKDLENGDVC
jgi:glycosyltransferase involved in cell wall biosynthesis